MSPGGKTFKPGTKMLSDFQGKAKNQLCKCNTDIDYRLGHYAGPNDKIWYLVATTVKAQSFFALKPRSRNQPAALGLMCSETWTGCKKWASLLSTLKTNTKYHKPLMRDQHRNNLISPFGARWKLSKEGRNKKYWPIPIYMKLAWWLAHELIDKIGKWTFYVTHIVYFL